MTALGILAFFVCFTIIQAFPPMFSGKQPEDFSGFSDTFRSLECNIEGGTTYEWFHNGSKITQQSSMFVMFRNLLYVLKNPVTDNYQGTYQCKVSSDDGMLLGPKINVHFLILGKFSKSNKAVEEVSVTVGKNLTLPCPPHTSSLNPFYHWGGQDATGPWFLRSAEHYMITNDGTLLFANVKKSDLEYINNVENGVSCVIESKGEIRRLTFSQRFLLHEVGESNKKPFGPIIRTNLKDQEVNKGASLVVFRCGAVGLPTPHYSWTFTGLDGTEIPIMSGQNGYELQDFNHILTVRSVEIKHGGWYTCKVSSDYGSVKHTDEKKAKLSVKVLF